MVCSLSSCSWIAFRRAQGIAALFWFLFVVVLTILLVPTALQAYDTLFERSLVSDTTRGLLYCLYGAPILMMLFLPETSGRTRVKAEIFLDLFQIAIVVALVYSTFFSCRCGRCCPPTRSCAISASATRKACCFWSRP